MASQMQALRPWLPADAGHQRSRSEAGRMLRIDKALRTRLLHLDVGGMVAILLKCATLKYKLGKFA
jgi:hypothetical protein